MRKNRDFSSAIKGSFVSFDNSEQLNEVEKYQVIKKEPYEINFLNGNVLHKVFHHHWVIMGGFLVGEGSAP